MVGVDEKALWREGVFRKRAVVTGDADLADADIKPVVNLAVEEEKDGRRRRDATVNDF